MIWEISWSQVILRTISSNQILTFDQLACHLMSHIRHTHIKWAFNSKKKRNRAEDNKKNSARKTQKKNNPGAIYSSRGYKLSRAKCENQQHERNVTQQNINIYNICYVHYVISHWNRHIHGYRTLYIPFRARILNTILLCGAQKKSLACRCSTTSQPKDFRRLHFASLIEQCVRVHA